MFDTLLLLIAGCLGGFLTGFAGIGGNAIFVPVLDYELGSLGVSGDILVKSVIANSLFITIFTGSIVSFKQYKIGNFFPREVVWIAVSGILSSWAMTYLIKQGTWYSRNQFNVVFTALLFPLLLKLYLDKREKTSEDKILSVPVLLLLGIFVGAITSLSGLGGGIVLIPILSDLLKLNIKKAASISTGVVPFLAASVCISYMLETPALPYSSVLRIGYVDFLFSIPLFIGTYALSSFGVKAAQKAEAKTIRYTFATVLLILFTKMAYELYKA
ncbi:sulfite exporter TauE/SafE family protein [Leptospira barantonii]|uniref:Probable membrane transporter protein n=1 Tax=Leptospira barantonii TaxID=2023184 RepID=A0ABX4NP43_9LEPT|nr:sulfite exporter TauE/SafE family protein [Leptospira barantonii]PJZ58606.1 hypothetical protein CH367_00680 [Leptospira barantonii]